MIHPFRKRKHAWLMSSLVLTFGRPSSHPIHFKRHTVWCSEIDSLMSPGGSELHASSDVREPISLHRAVHRVEHYSDYTCENDRPALLREDHE